MIWPAVLLAGLLAGCSGGPGEAVSPEAPSRTAASPPPTMGTPVRDGGLEFIVNGVRLGPSISSDHARYKAHGRYVVVGLSVTNVGDQPETYMAIDQKLIVDGKQYDYAAEPTIAAGHQRDVADKPWHRYQCADCVRRPSRHSTGQH